MSSHQDTYQLWLLIEKGGGAFILMRMNANGCKMFVFLGCRCTLNEHKFRKGEGEGCTNWVHFDSVLFLGQCCCKRMPAEASASNSAVMSLFTVMSPPANIPTTALVWSATFFFLRNVRQLQVERKKINVHLKGDDEIITFQRDVFDSFKPF